MSTQTNKLVAANEEALANVKASLNSLSDKRSNFLPLANKLAALIKNK